MKNNQKENQLPTRKDSLIKNYVVEESDLRIHKYKITFTNVKDIKLVYYTSTQSFMDSLKNFNTKFIISYEFSRTKDIVDESNGIKRIIKVKLPKIKNNS